MGLYGGVVAEDQSVIAEEGGAVCYCKMTEPMAVASRWVLNHVFMSVRECSELCVNLCGRNARFLPRLSCVPFLGAGSLARGFFDLLSEKFR